MAKEEVLAVPEAHLDDVVTVIRLGLAVAIGISDEARAALRSWCDAEEEYLRRLAAEEDARELAAEEEEEHDGGDN